MDTCLYAVFFSSYQEIAFHICYLALYFLYLRLLALDEFVKSKSLVFTFIYVCFINQKNLLQVFQ